MSTREASPPGDSDQDWGEIEHFVAEVAELSQSDMALGQFAGEVLNRTVALLAADGGAVWVCGSQSELKLQNEVNWQSLQARGHLPAEALHGQFLQSVIKSGEAGLMSPDTSAIIDHPMAIHAGALWVAAPFRMDGRVVGVVEVVHLQAPEVDAQQGNLQLLSMVSELTGDYFRRQELRQLRQADQRWRQYEGLVQRVHGDLDLRTVAYHLVNDGQSLVGCDRVSLVVSHRGDWRTIAVSGVDTFERRSPEIRALEGLANVVARLRRSVHYRGDMDEFPPQIETPLARYVDLSHATVLDLLPMPVETNGSDPNVGPTLGVLVIEKWEGALPEFWTDSVTRIAKLGESALANAIDYNTLPMLSLSRRIRRAKRFGGARKRKIVFAVAALLLMAVALVLIPAPFRVRVEGELQPEMRRDIYAPYDGEVTGVQAQHDDNVEQGQVLIVLRSRALELELQDLQGEYQATGKKLLAVESARLRSGDDEERTTFAAGQLASEEQELKELLASQQKQIVLLRQQRDQMTIRSPMKGRVLTWNPEELLANRPVSRGQLLMSTAAVDGPWVLEMLVPDHRVGYVLAARRERQDPLEVTFKLTSDRSKTYQGHVKQVSGRTEVIGGDRARVRVTADVPVGAIDRLRPGATVDAKIDCGFRSVGFVLLHDLIETVQRWVLF